MSKLAERLRALSIWPWSERNERTIKTAADALDAAEKALEHVSCKCPSADQCVLRRLGVSEEDCGWFARAALEKIRANG